MIWLVLQATPPSVWSNCLRGPPHADTDVASNHHTCEHEEHEHHRATEEESTTFAATAQTDTNITTELEGGVVVTVFPEDVAEATMDEAALAVPSVNALVARTLKPTPMPTPYVSEIWLGYHSFHSNLNSLYQATIWVISSNPEHHKKRSKLWKDLNKDLIPKNYKGDPKAKFYTIGAGAGTGSNSKNLHGMLSREDDFTNKLLGAVRIGTAFDPIALMTQIDRANGFMNENFKRTSLEFHVLPADGTVLYTSKKYKNWYQKGSGWFQFNFNGYISGLLSHLGYTVRKPNSGLYGWDKPVPDVFFKKIISQKKEVKNEVFKIEKCKGGKAEIWVGHHPVVVDGFDTVGHAKLWVISSDTTQHDMLPDWKDLERSRIPEKYEGDKNCAKFFTIGADAGVGNASKDLVGAVNRESDWKENLYGAFLLKRGEDPVGFKTKIDLANKVMNGNFQRTALRRETPLPMDWNDWGIGWEDFNSNGYVSGLLKYLNLPRSSQGDLPGWDKEVPAAFFQDEFTTDKQVKDYIFSLHKASKVKNINDSLLLEAETESTEVLTDTEQEEMSTLEP